MKERVKVFFSYGLFWIIFFVAARVLFLIYNLNRTLEMSVGDILLSIIHGLRLDLSATGYFLLIPGLFIVFTTYFKPRILNILLTGYTLILLVLCSLVIVTDLEMYTHWGFRLDATPLLYIGEDTPLAISGWSLFLLILLWTVLLSISLLVYKKLTLKKIKDLPTCDWKVSLVMLMITALMIAPIRGTVGVAPINTGMVYFHNSNIYANHAAINVVWNTGYALSKSDRLKYPDNFLDAAKTTRYFDELYTSQGHPVKLLNSELPNIVIIIMESFTYSFIEPMGGIPGVAPNFSNLSREGILFDHMYASGDRTDKGIVSILSGYPSQPVSSIIKYPKKTQNLPYLNLKLEKSGYHTTFTYGGNIDFANFRSYLSNAQFDDITHSDDFPEELNNSKWGVHDGPVFDRFFTEVNEAKSPFFKVMLSLSSHEPFDVPMETVFEGNDEKSKFMNSAHYADRCLGKFIEDAKKSEWWDNTLIVITADHGHSLPNNQGVSNPDRFRIPMLWLGGALAVKDTVVHNFASQTDIPNTILGQITQPDADFKFSRNVLDSTNRDFAVYVYNNGYGFIDSTKLVVYDNTGERYMKKSGVKDEKDLELGKAYMQTLYNDFNDR
ncbi:sulfatase-like hydrolase/transferase [Fulvivirga sp. 29W222]|uniref:Sulfatase-like hydrolase/transferase n=1 Tax=Fulvivirga marina TaxID=2494733 RepID=A0A937FVS5_9BACT|nr:alkaline phosphatase family protein [Fulvivirga marina]MBL6445191.1 sulfatase-like hydrolase/transferase [Fulvivirga marina]